MKLSHYTCEISLDDQNNLLYNTLSRKYYVYSRNRENQLWSFLTDLNRNSYSVEEVQLLRELMDKHIVIDEQENELAKLEYMENTAFYRNDTFRMTIYVTNACNFRCVYCLQTHEVRNIEDDNIANILDAIRIVSGKYRKLFISWFGGEPLLQYDKIRYMMEQALHICEEQHCLLESDITTNGYLLSDSMAQELKALHVETMQITADGCREIHDRRRVLVNQAGTYDMVVRNINIALNHQIRIVLRINIDEESLRHDFTLLDEIPSEHRHLVTVSVANLFENKEKISVYPILLRAINMGYGYSGRYNDYAGCSTCGNHSIVVNTNGDLLFCTNSGESPIGKLGKNGKLLYKNRQSYLQELMVSAREMDGCRECRQLPMCIGGCRLAKSSQTNQCSGKQNDGLSIEARARLDYYYDKKNVI